MSLGLPRHFHLLWDEDLEEMHGILEAIRDRRTEVVADWYQHYTLHFGDARTLSEAEFFRIFEPALFRNKNDLLENKHGSMREGRQEPRRSFS